MTRDLKPRAPVVTAPIAVSQLTCQSLLGIDDRRFLELVVPRCKGVARVGRLRIVEADEVRRVLRDLAPVEEDEPAPVAANDGVEPSVDDMLAKLGRRRVAGAAQ